MVEIVPNVKTGKRRDIIVIFELFKLDNRTKKCYSVVSSIKQREKRENQGRALTGGLKFVSRESVFLLSKFLRDPTVGSLRDKKGSCYTRRGLRVSTGFRGFPQTPGGRGFSLLGFFTLFKCFSMFRLVEALNGRLIGPKT